MPKSKETNLTEFKSEELSNLKVSKQTANYMRLTDDICDLWDDIYSAMADTYSESDADRLFERDFRPSLEVLKEKALEYVIDSIENNMAREKRTEVL